jgi:hypothetical protein
MCKDVWDNDMRKAGEMWKCAKTVEWIMDYGAIDYLSTNETPFK